MTTVAIINRSSVLSPNDVEAFARAATIQATHLGQAGYPIFASAVAVKEGDRFPTGAWKLYLDDRSDVEGAGGYHETTGEGNPVGRAFVKDAMEYGLDWTVTASHEFVEMLVDPWAVLAVDIGRGIWVAWEACDPVEADADGYAVNVTLADGSHRAVRLSDFITAAWFTEGSTGRMDWTRRLKNPLTLRPGGYASLQVDGEWTQEVANRRAPGEPVSRVEFSHRIVRRAARWAPDGSPRLTPPHPARHLRTAAN